MRHELASSMRAEGAGERAATTEGREAGGTADLAPPPRAATRVLDQAKAKPSTKADDGDDEDAFRRRRLRLRHGLAKVFNLGHRRR